tara:strand:+ start:546 stop:779 length:234 start_codon:yes stop_codon:yes gene_type:complete
MLHSQKLKKHLDNLKSQKDKTSILKNAAVAIHILETTIQVRNDTKDMFEIFDDIEVCKKAIDCIKEDINYDVYLDID